MKKIGRIFTSAAIACSFFSSAFAEKYKMKIKNNVNVSAENSNSVLALLESHLADLGHQQTLTSNEDFSLEVSLIGTGNGTRISVQKSSKNGDSFSTSQVATNENEFDRVAQGLASEINSGKKSKEVDTITNSDANKTVLKESTTTYFSGAFGPSGSYGLGAQGSLVNFRLGYLWEVSGAYRPGIFFVAGGTTNDPVASQFHVGISFDSILTKSSFTPYVGGDFAYGGFSAAKEKDEKKRASGEGFSLAGRVGYLMLRTSRVVVNTNVYYRASLFKVKQKHVGDIGLLVGLDF